VKHDPPDIGPIPNKGRNIPTTPKPEWQPVPGKPHLQVNSKGQLRTNIPANEAASFPAIDMTLLEGGAWLLVAR
jgi:hypothetical protein